jgi:hypothetical protein
MRRWLQLLLALYRTDAGSLTLRGTVTMRSADGGMVGGTISVSRAAAA